MGGDLFKRMKSPPAFGYIRVNDQIFPPVTLHRGNLHIGDFTQKRRIRNIIGGNIFKKIIYLRTK